MPTGDSVIGMINLVVHNSKCHLLPKENHNNNKSKKIIIRMKAMCHQMQAMQITPLK